MKKMLLAVGVFCIQNTFAQTVVDFEDLTVPGADSAWLGSDGSGGFTSNGVYFENSYDTQYDYWSGGFIYSNSTNVTTPGFTNDYSAYTGNGAENSSNYAVNYGGSIDFTTEKLVSGIAITNTTYAALSMLNGDSFGKKFGSSMDAHGNPDGTNGDDWFRLLIIGKDAQSNVTDTVVFYLADYRFPDTLDDYIVNTWETVDLTPLGSVQFLEFALESSDVGQFGMNTPAYFALDNLTYGTLHVAQNAQIVFNAYPNPANEQIHIQSDKGTVTIFSMTGETLISQATTGTITLDLSGLNAGAYLVEVQTANGIGRQSIIKH